MSYEAVIFDLDGVLVDSEPLYLEVYKNFVIDTGYAMDDIEIRRLVGMNNYQDYVLVNEWTDNHFIDYDTYQKELKKHFKAWGPIDYYDVVNEGLLQLLENLKKRQIKIGLASASSRNTIDRVLKQIEVYDYFDYYLSGHEIERSKPHPDIYLEVAKQLEVSPEKCLVIEDSENGIKSGKAAGMFVIAKREDRFGFSQEEADLIINELTEFPYEMLRKETDE